MNRAAAALHTVQSSVTARIRNLEDELGTPLFVRHNRGVILSDAGKRLLAYSERIQGLVNEAIATVREDGVPKGTLRIGSTEPTASLRLPHALATYAGEYPAVALTLETGNTAVLIQRVLDRTLDGAFVAAPIRNAALLAEPFFLEELVLVSHKSLDSIEDLRKRQSLKAIVLEEACSYRELVGDMLSARGITYQTLPLASFAAIRNCVESGVGVTLVPRAFLAESWQGAPIAVHELSLAESKAETIFVRRADAPKLGALEAFLATARSASNLSV